MAIALANSAANAGKIAWSDTKSATTTVFPTPRRSTSVVSQSGNRFKDRHALVHGKRRGSHIGASLIRERYRDRRSRLTGENIQRTIPHGQAGLPCSLPLRCRSHSLSRLHSQRFLSAGADSHQHLSHFSGRVPCKLPRGARWTGLRAVDESNLRPSN
jgi:hypothetical protein